MPRGIQGAPTEVLNAMNRGSTRIKTTSKFTEKQKLFLDHWARGETIYAASVKAGYSDCGAAATKLSQSQPALDYYHREKRKYEDAAQMSRKKVMDMLVEAYELAKLTAEPSSMVAAAREIGKMCGYYAPTESRMKIDVTGNVAVQRINSMSDEELIKMISEPPLLTDDARDPA